MQKLRLMLVVVCLFFAGVCVAAEKDEDFRRFRFDLGFSVGSLGGDTFFEANVGLEYFLKAWLSWRNAVFYRFGSGSVQNHAGWDSSVRTYWATTVSILHAGVGYRLTTLGTHAPFVEAGALFRAGGIALGAGVKYILFTLTDKAPSDQLIYNILFGARAEF